MVCVTWNDRLCLYDDFNDHNGYDIELLQDSIIQFLEQYFENSEQHKM